MENVDLLKKQEEPGRANSRLPYPSRPTVSEVNLAALRNNCKIIRKRTGNKCKLMAIVKADAYGHGAVPVSRALEKEGVDFLGVAILEEAVELRNGGIKAPILILGGLMEGQEGAIFDFDLTPVIFTLDSASRINEEALRRNKTANVHVKIDTGMGRLGINGREVNSFFSALKTMKGLSLEGAATHFSTADCRPGSPEASFTLDQIDKFKKALAQAESLGFHIKLRHASNSAAIFNYDEAFFNMVRPGIMLYGAYPSPDLAKVEGLRGVMSFRTGITEIREIDKGSSVSYGRTFIAERKSRIAVVPVGYADGYRRELSNRGEVLVRGKRAKIAGRVCMDMTMIDVTDIEGVNLGDTVYLFGGEGSNAISVDEVAEITGTIPYEILCGISQRVPRVYIEGED
ncbi:MAG: alanine racemase [Deltaproteobacteria bacterium]|nr:alanine racemase [Deltaproteobacteria bacterium]